MDYNLTMFINNSLSFIYTKLFWKEARLVRFPIRVFGKKHIKYGSNLTIGNYCKFDIKKSEDMDVNPSLIIGDNCTFGDMIHIAVNNSIEIGNGLLTASRVFITDSNHGNYSGNVQSDPKTPPIERKMYSIKTVIGNNVWIGENVSILAGSTIGDGVIIGANSVVNGILPDNSICAGIPARVIKVYDERHKCWKRV